MVLLTSIRRVSDGLLFGMDCRLCVTPLSLLRFFRFCL